MMTWDVVKRFEDTFLIVHYNLSKNRRGRAREFDTERSRKREREQKRKKIDEWLIILEFKQLVQNLNPLLKFDSTLVNKKLLFWLSHDLAEVKNIDICDV